jgi:hypothetical protein
LTRLRRGKQLRLSWERGSRRELELRSRGRSLALRLGLPLGFLLRLDLLGGFE